MQSVLSAKVYATGLEAWGVNQGGGEPISTLALESLGVNRGGGEPISTLAFALRRQAVCPRSTLALALSRISLSWWAVDPSVPVLQGLRDRPRH